MTHSNEALSRLRGITLENLTTTEMDSVLGPSSISPNINGQLKQAEMLAEAVSAQRTYCGGVLPIPEAGVVAGALVDPLGSSVIQPPGTEIWDIKQIRGVGQGATATAIIAYSDGTSDAIIYGAASFPTGGGRADLAAVISAPILLTNSLYLKFTETGGAAGIGLTYAYQVVSL